MLWVELNSTASTTTPTTWLDSRETEGLEETEGRSKILLADLMSHRMALQRKLMGEGRLSTKRLARLLTRLLSRELDHRIRRRLYSTTTTSTTSGSGSSYCSSSSISRLILSHVES